MKIDVRLDIDLAKRLRVAPAGVKSYVDRVAMAPGAARIVRDARLSAPQAETGLVNAIQSTQTGVNAFEIVARKQYASSVEQGTGPGGTPPARTLQDWIRVKGIQPRDPAMSLKDLVFVLQRSIRAKGTRAQPFMRPSVEKNVEKVLASIETALRQGMLIELSQ